RRCVPAAEPRSPSGLDPQSKPASSSWCYPLGFGLLRVGAGIGATSVVVSGINDSGIAGVAGPVAIFEVGLERRPHALVGDPALDRPRPELANDGDQFIRRCLEQRLPLLGGGKCRIAFDPVTGDGAPELGEADGVAITKWRRAG